MLPLRDTIRSYTFPKVNVTLIGINALVFLFELSLPSGALDKLIVSYGLTAAQLPINNPLALLADPSSMTGLFTHMFLHGGWFHFLSNVWTLHIFGDNVEDRMGSARYLVFYIGAGLTAGILQVLADPYSNIPAIGASGAIAGVLGAYFMLFPGGRVVTLIVIFLFPWFVEIPALFYLGFWFISQLFSGLASMSLHNAANMGGVAWWAHVGGFLFGALLFRLFTPRLHPAYKRLFPPDAQQY